MSQLSIKESTLQRIHTFSEFKHGRYLRVAFYNNSKIWKDQHAGRTSVSEFVLGERIPSCKALPTILKTLEYKGKWTNTSDGYCYNGRDIGATTSCNITLNASLFGFLGDLWNEMVTASDFVNGENAANISRDLIAKPDLEKNENSSPPI